MPTAAQLELSRFAHFFASFNNLLTTIGRVIASGRPYI